MFDPDSLPFLWQFVITFDATTSCMHKQHESMDCNCLVLKPRKLSRSTMKAATSKLAMQKSIMTSKQETMVQRNREKKNQSTTMRIGSAKTLMKEVLH